MLSPERVRNFDHFGLRKSYLISRFRSEIPKERFEAIYSYDPS